MRPLLQHASRSLLASTTPLARQRTTIASFGRISTTEAFPRCPRQTSSLWTDRARLGHGTRWNRQTRRLLSSSRCLAEEKKSTEPTEFSQPLPDNTTLPPRADDVPLPSPGNESPSRPSISNTEDPVARVPAEDLPSHREAQRWDFSKRINEVMDELLPKLAVVTQKVNTYTGTDYSSIEALRQEIKDQEKLVKTRRSAIDGAKHALDAAHAQQAAAQKEVVALLERKHSWSATDLERYMSLIRSEHLNEQAVREAKESVITAENALEEARTLLEKRERAQYHEEQIWSDTIRRNSTWVTFGLMGLNIFLLLASLVAIEPWRRRRMVREIKSALEAQQAAVEAATAPQTTFATQNTNNATPDAVEKPVEPSPVDIVPAVPVETDKPAVIAIPPIAEIERHSSNPEVDVPLSVSKDDQKENAYVTANPVTEPSFAEEMEAASTPEQIEKVIAIDIQEEVREGTSWQEKLTAQAKDLMSDRPVSITKKDFTNAVLEAAAVGAVVTAVVLQIILRTG